MKVFTVRNGQVSEGAKTVKVALKGAGVEIDAIVVGEEGRGRVQGVLPVQGAPADGLLRLASVGTTNAGKPKLISAGPSGPADTCIVVFRTEAGYRGGASHTGDRRDGPCPHRGKTLPQLADRCYECGMALIGGDYEKSHPDQGDILRWDDFPGEIICRGKIAQGDAGYMGGNEQIVAVMPAGVWFRTGYSGRLYGAPTAHYYRFDGERIVSVTWAERQMLEEAQP